MTDPRRWPANGRVAAAHLADAPEGLPRVKGEPRTVVHPLTDLCRTPEGARDRQVLYGAPVTVYEDHAGWSFVETGDDAYVGYIETAALGVPRSPTHRVSAPGTRLYHEPGARSDAGPALSLNARVVVEAEEAGFARTQDGYIPLAHLRPDHAPEADPVAVAARLLGAPYVWGGNSREGIDCSGLVQIACQACNIPCPGDSDMQAAEMGTLLPPGAPRRRGDLIFWKGHVAWVSAPDALLHANGHHMAVAYEHADAAIARIAASDGPVTAHRRLDLPFGTL
ncbi:C40 family peptidase [Chachezhania antarctica]|uniref:C40 family peptidase n=1 Tax=Chachezhania antarctica TaxID=2340860 RepID=UPI000EB19B0A|nr:NlpC/P60 family protein [Chachezhania antarctica]